MKRVFVKAQTMNDESPDKTRKCSNLLSAVQESLDKSQTIYKLNRSIPLRAQTLMTTIVAFNDNCSICNKIDGQLFECSCGQIRYHAKCAGERVRKLKSIQQLQCNQCRQYFNTIVEVKETAVSKINLAIVLFFILIALAIIIFMAVTWNRLSALAIVACFAGIIITLIIVIYFSRKIRSFHITWRFGSETTNNLQNAKMIVSSIISGHETMVLK